MNLLIVDDEVQILESIQLLFDWEKLGFHTIGTAQNGLEALDYLNKYSIDVLITDVNMPHMNGLELIEAARKLDPSLSVIIISSYDDFAYVKKALSLKVEDYLLKPIQEDEFSQVLMTLKEKREKSNLYNDFSIEKNNDIRSNLLNRLIKNRISYLELEEKSHFFYLDLYHPFYKVIVIKLKGDTQSFNILPQLTDKINSSSLQHEIFEDFDNNIVLLLGGPDKLTLETNIKNILEPLTSLLKNESIGYISSLGYLIEDICECHKSYLSAINLSSQVSTEKYFIQIAEGESPTQDSTSLDEIIDLKELRILLAGSNFDQVSQFITSSFEVLNLNANINFSVKSLILRLISWIDLFWGEQDISFDESSHYYDYLTLSILEETQMINLLNYVLEHINLYFEQKNLYHQQYSPIISQVKKYIDNNFHENVSLKTLGYKFQINPSYLGQLFSKEVGESFNDYINRLINEKAFDLLLNSTLSNQDIAQELGYTETSYFYRKFKAYHGASPNSIRQSHQS